MAKKKSSRNIIRREIKRKQQEEAQDKANQQPYRAFKRFSESIEGYSWDEEKLTLYPETGCEIEPPELPEADCMLAITNYTAYYAEMMKETGQVTPPTFRVEPLLHALYETKANTDENAPLVITEGYKMREDLLIKLKDYSPKIVHNDVKTPGKLNKQGAKSHARTELVRHLGSIPFLGMDNDRYWEFAIAAYEKYQLGNLFSFILEEGEKRGWVGEADQTTHPGLSLISFQAMVQLCNLYPPIKESGAQVCFKVFQLSTGYYLYEILLPLTKDMEPARRVRSLVTFRNLTGRGPEFGDLVPFSANLLFKNTKEVKQEAEIKDEAAEVKEDEAEVVTEEI